MNSTLNKRRLFLKKASALTAGLFIGVFKVRSNKKLTGMSVVKKVSPLGFQWQASDPFLFCVHHLDYFPKGNGELGPDKTLLNGRNIGQDFTVKDGWRMYHGKNIPGFPVHPHRGFETVTIVRKGYVDHSDSLGAAGRYGNGDLQWMTAGKGIQHSEMFPLLHNDKENTMELFQIWINLPAKNKLVDPHFKMLWAETIPKISETDKNGKSIYIEVFAGKFNNETAPTPPPNSWASGDNDVAIWNIKMEAQAELKLPVCGEMTNRTLYLYEGDTLLINETELKNYHAAELLPSTEVTLKNGDKDCSILILQGKPINEPVVQYGPFVMNTKAEIQQTYNEYQQTQFGGWPWDSNEPTHGKELHRFAKHSDGRTEKK